MSIKNSKANVKVYPVAYLGMNEFRLSDYMRLRNGIIKCRPVTIKSVKDSQKSQYFD